MPEFTRTICHLIITTSHHSASLHVLATQKRSGNFSKRKAKFKREDHRSDSSVSSEDYQPRQYVKKKLKEK